MTADCDRDAAIAKRVQRGQKALSRNTKYVLDAVDLQLIDLGRCGGSVRRGLVH
jgi:hypothetical protein